MRPAFQLVLDLERNVSYRVETSYNIRKLQSPLMPVPVDYLSNPIGLKKSLRGSPAIQVHVEVSFGRLWRFLLDARWPSSRRLLSFSSKFEFFSIVLNWNVSTGKSRFWLVSWEPVSASSVEAGIRLKIAARKFALNFIFWSSSWLCPSLTNKGVKLQVLLLKTQE